MQAAFLKRPAAAPVAFLGQPFFVGPTPPFQFFDDRQQRTVLLVQIEDFANAGGFRGVDHQLGTWSRPVHIVAQDGNPARPFAFPALGGDLVADAFADDLAFELGERQQYIQHQPAHRTGSIQLLRDGNERHLVPVEDFHDAGEIQQRPTQPVQFVNDNAIHFPGLDVFQQPLQRRPFHVAAGIAAIVIPRLQADPSLPK